MCKCRPFLTAIGESETLSEAWVSSCLACLCTIGPTALLSLHCSSSAMYRSRTARAEMREMRRMLIVGSSSVVTDGRKGASSVICSVWKLNGMDICS